MALEYSAIQGAWVELWYLALVAVTPAISTHTISVDGGSAANSQNQEVASGGTSTAAGAFTFTGVPSSGTDDCGAADPSTLWPLVLSSPYTSYPATNFNKGTSVGAVVTFTPSIVVNGVTKTTPTATVTYINSRYWGSANFGGTGAIPTVTTGAVGLGSSGLSTSQYGSFAITIAAAQYGYFSHRSALTAVAFISINGEVAGFTDLGTNAQTNASGFSETFRSYRTNLQNLGAVTMVTSASQLANRRYMGPSTDFASIPTADILLLDDTVDGTSDLTTQYAGTFNPNAAVGEYLWYCFPSRYTGTPVFTVGGFSGGFTEIGTVSHTNDRGFVENYRTFRSDNPSLGAIQVVVS